jgi:hypothetical protein
MSSEKSKTNSIDVDFLKGLISDTEKRKIVWNRSNAGEFWTKLHIQFNSIELTITVNENTKCCIAEGYNRQDCETLVNRVIYSADDIYDSIVADLFGELLQVINKQSKDILYYMQKWVKERAGRYI